MAELKKQVARWVVQGIGVLGIVWGVSLFSVAITMSLSMPREDIAMSCFVLGFSAIMLVVGAWLARDCYRMLRRRSFEAIRSISALLSITLFGAVARLLRVLETSFAGEERFMRHHVNLVVTLSGLLAVVLVYSLCRRLLTRLLQVAYSPEELAGTHPPTR